MTTCVYSSALNFKEDILVGKLGEAGSDDCFPQNILNQDIVFGLFYNFFFTLSFELSFEKIPNSSASFMFKNTKFKPNVCRTWTNKINKIKGIALQL